MPNPIEPVTDIRPLKDHKADFVFSWLQAVQPVLPVNHQLFEGERVHRGSAQLAPDIMAGMTFMGNQQQQSSRGMAFQPQPKPLGPIPSLVNGSSQPMSTRFGSQGYTEQEYLNQRASSLPPPSIPSPIKKRNAAAMDMDSLATLLPTLYPNPALSGDDGNSSKGKQGNALMHTSSFVSDEGSTTSDSTSPSLKSQMEARPIKSPSPFQLHPPLADHPLSPAEQFEVMDRIRRDLVGIDSSTLKGPLKALARQNESYFPQQPVNRIRSPRRKQSINQSEQMTVSPKEAFVDYEDVASQSNSKGQPASSSSSFFAPLNNVYSGGNTIVEQALRQTNRPVERAASAEPPSPAMSKKYRFDFPKNAVKWENNNGVRIRRQSTGGTSDDYSPFDYFSPSLSEDEPSPPTPPPFTGGLPSMSSALSARKMARGLPTIPPQGIPIDSSMPLLSRAAEESYFSRRGSMPIDDSSESASQAASPRDFYSSSSTSSLSDASRSSSAQSNPSASGTPYWLSGPPRTGDYFPSPPIALDGQIRSANLATPRSNKSAPRQVAKPKSAERPADLRRQPGANDAERGESAERSTIGVFDSSDETTNIHDQTRGRRSLTPKRKRTPPLSSAPRSTSRQHTPRQETPQPIGPTRMARTASAEDEEFNTPSRTSAARSSRLGQSAYRESSEDDVSDEYVPDDDDRHTAEPSRKRRRRNSEAGSEEASVGSPALGTAASRAGGVKTSTGGIKCDYIIDTATGKRCGTIFRRPYDVSFPFLSFIILIILGPSLRVIKKPYMYRRPRNPNGFARPASMNLAGKMRYRDTLD